MQAQVTWLICDNLLTNKSLIWCCKTVAQPIHSMLLISFVLIANAQSSWWWTTTTTTTPGQAPVVTTTRSDTPPVDDDNNNDKGKGKTEKQRVADPVVSNVQDATPVNLPDITSAPPPVVQAPVQPDNDPAPASPPPVVAPVPKPAPIAAITQAPSPPSDDSKQVKETPSATKTGKTNATPPKNQTTTPPKSNNTGAVVGGVCGAIGGIILLLIVSAKYMKRKPKYSDSYLDPEGSYDSARRISVVPNTSHYSSHYYTPTDVDEMPSAGKYQYQYSSSNSEVSDYTQSTDFTNLNSSQATESIGQRQSTHLSTHEYYEDPTSSIYSATESAHANSVYQANSILKPKGVYEDASLPGSEIYDNYNAQSVYYEPRP